ncbi:MAG: hypothetical protein KGD64_06545 [Candidatus Heimdallarchaeota archaeon]|nr:hypothetical protein [Candidatus Heimdallarchaeota archaeon]
MKFNRKTSWLIFIVITFFIFNPLSVATSNEFVLEIREIGQFDFSGYTYAVKVVDDIAYVTCGDFYLLNISDPSSITEISSFPLYRGHNFRIKDDIAYITDEIFGLKLLNISDPSNPNLISQINDGGTVGDLFIVDNLVYVADVDDGLEIIDVSNATNPTKIAQYDEEGGISTVLIQEEILYTIIFRVDGRSWLNIMDISDIENMVVLGSYDVNILAHDIAVEDGVAYVANKEDGIMLLNVTDPTNIELLSSEDIEGTIENLYTEDNLVYLANKIAGVQVYDVIDPLDIQKVGEFVDVGNPQDVEVIDNLIYVTDSSEGLEILEINGLDKLRETSGYSFLVFISAVVALFIIKRIRKKLI